MSNLREIRVRQLPNTYRDGKWITADQPLVRLGDVGKWSVVRRADSPQACPFVISRRDWDKLPAQGQAGDPALVNGNTLRCYRPSGFDPSRWRTVDTLPRGKRVEARTCRGEIIEGRTLGKSNQVRDSNTVTDKDGFRHPVTHWRPL